MSGKSGPDIVENGLVLCLDAANKLSYPGSGTTWSSGWAGSYSNPTYSFDGNLSTSTIQNGSATYTFAGGGLSVSGTVRIYVSFGASSGQVSGLPNVIVVDGTDVSSKMAAANVYSGTPGWIDITTEVGAVFNTIVMTGTGGRSNPSIYAIEVNGQILIDAVAVTAWSDLSGNNNTGTLTNGPTFSAANLGSIVFDGTNDYAVVNPVSAFNIYCISIWFKPTTIINSTSVSTSLIHFKSSIGKYIGFGPVTNRVSNEYITIVQEPGDKRTAVNDGGSLSAGIWYNIVFNYESSQYNIYINNTLKSTTVGSSTGNVPLITDPDFIYLNSYEGTSGYLDSSLSMCMIYNRSLTATEMLQNYNATKGRFGL